MEYFDTETFLRPLLETEYPEDEVIISAYSHESAEMRHWYPNYPANELEWDYEAGDLFHPMMRTASYALDGQAPDYVSLIWI